MVDFIKAVTQIKVKSDSLEISKSSFNILGQTHSDHHTFNRESLYVNNLRKRKLELSQLVKDIVDGEIQIPRTSEKENQEYKIMIHPPSSGGHRKRAKSTVQSSFFRVPLPDMTEGKSSTDLVLTKRDRRK